jgi:hypothetical protein
MALFAAGGAMRGDGEVVRAMGLLWGEGGGNLCQQRSMENKMGRNLANFNTH